MSTQIKLGDIVLDVVKKDIKHLHLSVYPPTGRVRISAPLRMHTDTIRIFAISKLEWIRLQQRKLRAQQRETPREHVDRESHYLWGQRYLLQLVRASAPPAVCVQHNRIILCARPETAAHQLGLILAAWYRSQLAAAAAPLIKKWESVMGVTVAQLQVRRMKTRWGSCSPRQATIRLNTELAKKQPDSLEFIIVHEMAHILQRNHGPKFIALMDKFLPQWRTQRDLLNASALQHEEWVHGSLRTHAR